MINLNDLYKDIRMDFEELHLKLREIGKIFKIDFLGTPVVVNDDGIFKICEFAMPLNIYKIMHDIGYLFMYQCIDGTYVVEVYDQIEYKGI